MKKVTTVLVCLAGCLALGATLSAAAGSSAATPPELVAAYNRLADSILAVKKTEHEMVKSILAATFRHAEVTMNAAKAAVAAKQDAKASVEKLAALVSQLGNEGDNSVAAVRTRLLEGGHHHNAEGEKQGIYDDGFVIVTRAAKKIFLDTAQQIGKMAAAPTAAALDAAWAAVAKQYGETVK